MSIHKAINHPTPVASWQQEFAAAVSDPYELLALLALSPADIGVAEPTISQFPLRVPHGFVARMRKGDPNDPLLRQVLPVNAEYTPNAQFSRDPVGDLAARTANGLLHKYAGRVLLIATGACAVHCRYCFRRHFPYAENQASSQQWQPALDYMANDANIEEAILSGGDPLSLSDKKLSELIDRLEAIPHLTRLRIHTRLPLVIPSRITDDLLLRLQRSRLQTVIVVHSNHAQEIDHTVVDAIKRVADIGVTVLNQAVLLRGINDSVHAQVQLAKTLFSARILPYYVHLLDKVEGAAHFDVPLERARQLAAAMRAELPGYLMPRFVIEEVGAASKTPI